MTNVTIIITVMAVGSLLETVVPLFAAGAIARGRRAANLGLTTIVFLLNWLLSSLAAVAALSLRPTGVMARLGWPLWAQIAIGFVALDFSVGYLSHRTLHTSSLLWRFHRIHHSDSFVDATTTYRTHPVETVWRFVFTIVPIWIVGVPAQAVVIVRVVQAANGVLEHSNVRLWEPLDRLLSMFWVTPNIHRVHHSRDRRGTNSNYGNVLAVYDRLLGTYTPADRARGVVYGLDDVTPGEAGSLARLLANPIKMPT